jgi:hypothetical protein
MLKLALAAAIFAAGPIWPVPSQPLPQPTVEVRGRAATISLPFRTADRLAWVAATPAADAQPFMFQTLEVKPGAGPDGTDLAVFTYSAAKAGSTVLKFGLVPAGRVLIGLPATVYKGLPASTFQTQVSAP